MCAAKATGKARRYAALCLILKQKLIFLDPSTWSNFIKEAVQAQELGVIDYNLELDYDYWTYCTFGIEISPRKLLTELLS